MINIPFNRPYSGISEIKYIQEVINSNSLSSPGVFTKKCEKLLSSITDSPNVLLTSSCTHALEMSALLCNIEEGDEVIMSSYNFVSCGNAFVLRGAKIIFVDIEPTTMNINANLIESAITKNTKVIVAMHYAGYACDMDKIMSLSDKYDLFVVEDAAHCLLSYYKEKPLGSIGHLGTISFHSSKNIHCGEGGALLINDQELVARAEIIREKGTNRSAFLNGFVDKYSWVGIGSSYIMSELSAAFLYGQLLNAEEITQNRISIWNRYYDTLSNSNKIVGGSRASNGHIFALKCSNKSERNSFISFMSAKGISTTFHYIPLHSTEFGKSVSSFSGEDLYTTSGSECVVRLPIFYNFDSVDFVSSQVNMFFKN